MGQCCGSGGKKKRSKMDYSTVAELSQKTGIGVLDLKEYYVDFMKEYPSGQVTKKQFLHLYHKFFPGDNRAKKKAKQLFETFDQNGDGTIDFREFMLAVSVLSQGTMIQKLSLAFQLYDENSDGVLCYNEIMNIVKMMYCVAIEEGRTEGLPEPEVFAKNLFDELDVDKNGEVTLDEFTKVGCQDPTMASLLLCNVDQEAWT